MVCWSLLLDSSSWGHVLTPLRSAMKRSLCRPHAVRWATTGRALLTEAAAGKRSISIALHFNRCNTAWFTLVLFVPPAGPHLHEQGIEFCYSLPPDIPHPFNLDESGWWVNSNLNKQHLPQTKKKENTAATFIPSHRFIMLLYQLLIKKKHDCHSEGVHYTERFLS